MQNNLYIAKSSVSTILNASINNQDLDEAVLSGLVEAAIATVLAATTISKIKNNIMHASLGALKGTVVGRNGPLVGALDGLISAVLPEYFPEKAPEAEKLPEFNAEEAKQQEVTLLQQAELKAKIINKLTLLARISAQEGRGFDLAQAMEQVNNKIDSMNLSELQDLEKFFIASADSRSVANPQIKQAVFDKPESVQQQGNQANLDKLLAIQSRQILEAAASGTSVGISEVELGAIQAIGSTAYKFINGLAELGVDLAKLLYKGAWHATKVDLLTNPEYEGALSDEARNRLSQEIQQDRDKLNSVLSTETWNAILHGLKNHCVAEFQGIEKKAAAGDICGMAKQATEFAIDAALMASTAASGVKITAKLSKKAGKIVGATAKEVGNVAGDAACAMAKAVGPDSSLMFKYDMELQKAQRAAAIANKEITGTGRPIISKDSSRIIKEANGEVPARIVMGEVGGVELPCRLPKNNGFDQVFVQKTASGEVEKIFIIESKYNAKGKLHLGKTKNKGLQMSETWIEETLTAMKKFGSKEVRDTAKLIRKNRDKLSFKANVLKPDGSNKWYSLTPTKNGVIINNKPKTKTIEPKP